MKFEWQGKSWYIDGYLATQLDSLIYNLKDDWDFVILVSGDRTVRVGKSVLAMTVCAYISKGLEQLKLLIKPFCLDDVYFNNQDMMTAAYDKPKYSVNMYDEGREGLAASKAMKAFQHDLLDFFAECGQLNQIFVIVLPDFFEMKEDMAVARSEFLINVFRKEQSVMRDMYKTGTKIPIVKLSRGFFEFFSRTKKKNLYDKSRSTRRKSYFLVKRDFMGRFTNQYVFGEEDYRQKKKDSLKRFADKKKETRQDANLKWRDTFIREWWAEGMGRQQIKDILEEKYETDLSLRTINEITKGIKVRKAVKSEYISRLTNGRVIA